MSKGQRASDLMGIHASGGAIEAFYGGGIRDVVAHLRQCLVDASPTAVSFADLDSLEFSALPMFDDLDMGEGSGNPIFWLVQNDIYFGTRMMSTSAASDANLGT